MIIKYFILDKINSSSIIDKKEYFQVYNESTGILDAENYIEYYDQNDIISYYTIINKILLCLELFNNNSFEIADIIKKNENIKETLKVYKMLKNICAKYLPNFKKIQFPMFQVEVLINPQTNHAIIIDPYEDNNNNNNINTNKYSIYKYLYCNGMPYKGDKNKENFNIFLKENDITMEDFIVNDKFIAVEFISAEMLRKIKELGILNKNILKEY